MVSWDTSKEKIMFKDLMYHIKVVHQTLKCVTIDIHIDCIHFSHMEVEGCWFNPATWILAGQLLISTESSGPYR